MAGDGADAEACEVVFLAVIHTRHFGGFAADEGAARAFATLGDARDDIGGSVDIEAAGGVVIEEEEGCRTLHDEVVDAHGDEIDADGCVVAQILRQFEFGADAVGGADEERVVEARGFEIEQRAEAADAAHDAGARGAFGMRFDALDQRVSGIDIDTGLFITLIA